MEPGAPPPSGSLHGTEPVVTPPQPSSDGLDGPLGAGSSSDWFGQSFSLNLFGKSLSAGQARAVIIGLLVALALVSIVIVASVAGSDDRGPYCGPGTSGTCEHAGWFCNFDPVDARCERCLDCGSPDDSWAGCNNQCGLPDCGVTAACSGTAVEPGAPIWPTYELTIGYCRGGPAWEEGHNGYPELWDCTPGPEDAPLTLGECTAECNADPECGAFDIESHTASGETESECCLFKEGHSGDGSSERHCWLRSTTTAPPPPPPPNGAAYELTIGYCRGGPAWEPGHAGYPELWDCTPGPEDAPLTLEECTAECNADPECGAFDIEAHTAGGQTESECCLFKEGHRGDGAAQRHCWIRNDMVASRPALRGNAQVFSFTGGDQTVVVPDGVTRATVKLWGAGGGAGVWNREYSHSSGGGGGYTVGYLDVTPGETLIVMVGEGGYTARGMTGPSYGGGGRVMSDWGGAPNGLGHAGCGGGRSAVFQGTGTALAEIATAGGGGGGGEGLASWNDGHGGGGGGEEGRPATDNGLAYSGDGTLGGSGGTQTSKGGGGTCGADDSLDQHVGVCTNAPLAGSGGGGWYGGGAPTGNDKSGGGGSGFAGRLASGITIAGTDGTNLHDTPNLNMGVGVGGESGGFNDVHYAGTVGHGGAPSDGTPDVSTGAGGKGGDGMAVIIWGEDDPSGWAKPAPVDLFGGPTACTAIHPGNAADECIKGVQQMDTLWRDRDYGWTTAPADILDGRWTYVRPALEVGEGAPCPNEGGFAGTLDQPAVVAICCANHCGDENTPTAESDGVALSWTIHPGTWALSGHGGEPCSFYEARLPVGTHNICCSSCWASGLFFAKAPDNAGEDSSGPLVCESLTSTVTDFTCVVGVTGSETLWADRDYAWVEDQAPSDVLDGEWTYARSSLEVRAGAACTNEGGFRGHVAEHVVVALCCANHCGDENLPTGEGADAVGAWTQHPGTFSISGHGGSPCTFYETRLQPGDYQLCCESCWASGAFFSHFHHELPVGEDDSIGSAGPMLCDAVSSSTPSECEFAVGASATLWTDRAYSWITGPTDILDSQWTYMRPALEVGAGAPCAHEGGFRGNLREDSNIAVCCANHCGDTNRPTGSGLTWSEHPGAFSITGHGGSPCTFYETRAHAGPVEVCCSTCWSSGVFLSVAERVGSIAGTGPVRCAAITSDSMTECVESPSAAEVLWSDRQYSWIDAPAGMLDGDWTYAQTPLEVGAGAPCPHEGGFRGTIATEAVLAICCANHCGSENMPRSGAANLDWVQHPGTFAITGHGGSPCTFFESQVSAGDYEICCESCWGSGIFLTGQSSLPQSCQEIMDRGTTISSLYQIDPDGAGGIGPFTVYCDMETMGGGWTLVMDREDDMPTIATQGTLGNGIHGQAIDDERFMAMKPRIAQVMLVSYGENHQPLYRDDESWTVVADVEMLNQARCRSWGDVSSLLHTPLVWDEDSAPACLGQGGDYSEILGHGNAADGGGRDVSATTDTGRQNYIGDHSSLHLYADANGVTGDGEYQYVSMWVRSPPMDWTACATATTFIIRASTEDSPSGRPDWFELSELKLFNEAGENVAPQADRVELLVQPSNPDDVAMINDDMYWGSGGHFVSWENEHGFHGRDLVQLTFRTPQAITGAELYSTNYESFGTDSVIVADTGGADGQVAIPVRMVFLADNNPGGQNCFAGGEVVERPCSTMEGQEPFADASLCQPIAGGR